MYERSKARVAVSTPNTNHSGRTESGFVTVKREIRIAWIFSLAFLVLWAIGFVLFFVIMFAFQFVIGILSSTQTGGLGMAVGMLFGTAFLILLIPSMFVFRRINRMRKAANAGDARALVRLNSTIWGIVALIFNGIIPGVLLLLVQRPISQLANMQEVRIPSNVLSSAASTPPAPTRSVAAVTTTSAASSAPIAQPPTTDALEKIMKLKESLDSGEITRAEFDQRKRLMLHPKGSPESSQRIENELEKAKSLYDSGVLTKEEYEDIKKSLLESGA